jgi:glycosyltransferase involved in cell wall biosynthesis
MSSDSRKILVLTPRYPYPTIGGDRLRIYQICKELSKTHKLTLLSICDTKEEMSAAPPTDQVFASIHKVFLPKWKSYINTATNILGSTPLQVAYYHSSEFAEKLQQLLPHHDVSIAHLLRTGNYTKDSEKPSVVEMTDAISMNYEKSTLLNKISATRSIIYNIEQKRLRKYEKEAPLHHDLLSFVSKIDANYLYGTKIPNNVIICGNGVDTEQIPYQFQENRTSKGYIAFIGNMVSLQNQDAAYWFATTVLPMIRAKGDFVFRIIGQIPEKARTRFQHLPGVDITGKVASIPSAAQNCFVGVCPVRVGAGVQNKLLEYMALGLPAVTTKLGLEGVYAKDTHELYVADTPEEIAQRIIMLWHDVSKARTIAINARDFVENNHSWPAVLRPLTDQITKLLRKDQ